MYDPIRQKNYVYSGKLGTLIADCIAEKRSFGYLYNTEAKKLSEFSRMTLKYVFPDNTLTQEVVEAWLTRRSTDADKTFYSRFSVIKSFADYLRRHGFEAFMPMRSDLPKLHTHNYVPHVFTHNEIQRFFEAIDSKKSFPSVYEARYHAMMRMIFELLYCCGLRVSEAIFLTEDDVDICAGLLTIRFAKFEKTRYVPMSSAVIADLKCYMDSYVHEPFLFPGRNGQHLSKGAVYEKFRMVLLEAKIPHNGRGKGPRVHDFRHTFACHCLELWIKKSVPLSSVLPRLSTYLGHNTMSATEKYLRMTAENYPEISEKLSEKYGYLIHTEANDETN